MEKLILATAALVGLASSAAAADLQVPLRRAPPQLPELSMPMPQPVPVFAWTGFYAGVNGGYGFGGDSGEVSLSAPSFAFTPNGRERTRIEVKAPNGRPFLRKSSDEDGILGGGQVGYNMQFGMFVAGVEADIQAIDRDVTTSPVRRVGTADVSVSPGQGPFTIYPLEPGAKGNVAFFRRGGDLDYFGTVRGRIGVAFDRVLVYATGGLAWTTRDDGDYSLPRRPFFVNNAFTPSGVVRARNVAAAAREDRDDLGFVVGGGIEYAITDTISAKIEGLYVNFGDEEPRRRIVGVTNTGLAIRQKGGIDNPGEFGLVRAGLNFRLPPL
jgi:outer membrane immunogenic protein